MNRFEESLLAYHNYPVETCTTRLVYRRFKIDAVVGSHALLQFSLVERKQLDCILSAKWPSPAYVVDFFVTKLHVFPFASFTFTCLHEDCNPKLYSVRFWLRCPEAALIHLLEIRHWQELVKRCARKCREVSLISCFLIKILYRQLETLHRL